MADYRSKSFSGAQMKIQPHYTPTNFRSYSTSSHNYSTPPPPPPPPTPRQKLKKGSKSWSFNEAEFQRKRRVASYKVYSVEGKLKGSVTKSVRWLKNRLCRVMNEFF